MNQEQLREQLNKVPIWWLEDYLYEAKEELTKKAEKCESLKDALDLGVNSVRLQLADDEPDVYVGCKNLDGTYDIAAPYSEKMINTYPVQFLCLETDDDGYTIAIFQPTPGEDE